MFYPAITPDEIGNPGEQLVAEILVDRCPSDWTIVYSKSWLWRDTQYNHDRLTEGEIDFVVIVPQKGVVCLEVKSAKQYRLTSRGRWERFDEGTSSWVVYPKSPWVQAQNNKHALANVLKQQLGMRQLPCAYGAAVVFPRGEHGGELPVGEADDMVLVDATRLSYLPEAIEGILDAYARGPGDTDAIRHLLCPEGAVFRHSLSLDVRNANRKLLRLTENQVRILRGLDENRMIQVLGGAGTGKTILALELAKSEAAKGHSVLFMCFSRKLSSWVTSQLDGGRITSVNFHALARRYSVEAGLPWPETTDGSFWETGVCDLFLNALERLGRNHKFDTVIIDEVQDYEGSWLMLARELWNEAGRFAIFGDAHQAVFGREVLAHQELARFVLQDNCRNTRQIAFLCNRILENAGVEVDEQSIAGLPDGSVPRIVCFESANLRKLESLNQVRHWQQQGLTPDQIAVLSPWAADNCLGVGDDDCRVDGIPFTRDLDTWAAGTSCLFDTIKGFKGLEADAVILTDVPAMQIGFSAHDAYVACSRAKHQLTVVAADVLARNAFRSWSEQDVNTPRKQ